MITIDGLSFFDQEALVDRLTAGVQEASKEVVFVVGAALTAPTSDRQGVADVASITEMIRGVFVSRQAQLDDLDRALLNATNRYQTAFQFLQGRRGQDGANRIIRQAVWRARLSAPTPDDLTKIPEDELRQIDEDTQYWSLSPGVEALGQLISQRPKEFGAALLTSNFDPLIEVAIRKAGGIAWRTALHSDGDLLQSRAEGCHVVHLHGFWHGSDTLHTGNQLSQQRPSLKNSLLEFLRDKTVVVLAYGGWNDIFTSALESLVGNQASYPEILWCFHAEAPEIGSQLRTILQPGIDRNRVTLYSGIDCHNLLPKLLESWHQVPLDDKTDSKVVPQRPLPILRRLDCDRPPSIDAWVGREAELRSLEASGAKVFAICGFGGQGKSLLAAKFLQVFAGEHGRFAFWDWRDCKEEGNRLRTQVLAAIQRVSGDDASTSMLGAVADADLARAFADCASQHPGVFVFDNVDHYVDLEHGRFVGLLDLMVREFCRADTRSTVICTCRPVINYGMSSVATLTLKGISFDEARDLFRQRLGNVVVADEHIRLAYDLTDGHVFWLDLMAVQTARVPGVTLDGLVEDIRRGRGEAPDILSSIWETLPDRERIVLRAMAETLRPESESMIEGIVSRDLNYQKFKRALRSLISLNLVVVKPEKNAPDLYDLHPLVRQFVRKNFARTDRVSFIDVVLKQYAVIIHGLGGVLGIHLPISMLERWSQKAELEIEAGRFADAFSTMESVVDSLVGGGHVEEYVRVSRLLFEAVDWSDGSSKYPGFDSVLVVLVACLNDLELFEDADDYLERYRQSIPLKTARYIRYCDAMCHSFWIRQNYEKAIEWGAEGFELQSASNVDTQIDCSHNLALARRDGGNPEMALEYFLGSHSIEELLRPGKADSYGGSLYGNVGRCLHMQGQVPEALICYRKSMEELERDQSAHRQSNLAFAREWVGDALVICQRKAEALAFYVDAESLLRKWAPARVRRIRAKIAAVLEGSSDLTVPGEFAAQRVVSAWQKSAP